MRSTMIAAALLACGGTALGSSVPFNFASPIPHDISGGEGWRTYRPFELHFDHLTGNNPAVQSPKHIPTDKVFESAYLYGGSASGLWVVTYDPATLEITRAAVASPLETIQTSPTGRAEFWTRYDLSPFQIGRGGLWHGDLAILLGNGAAGTVGYQDATGGWMPYLFAGAGAKFSGGQSFDDLDFDPVGSRLIGTPGATGPAPGAFWEPSFRFGPFIGFSYDRPWRTRGDANLDGSVDLADFGLLKAAWGDQGSPWSGADFSGDGVVDESDLRVLNQNFGWRAPAAVPEPAAWLLAVMGAVLLCLLQWRTHTALRAT